MQSKKHKGGFSLIELLTALAIFAIITSISFNVIISSMKEYFIYIDKIAELDNLDNCMINIDNILRDNYITTINSENNQIEVVSKLVHNGKTIKKKIIYKKDNTLMVKTLINDELDTSIGNNVLLKNVENFQVLRKGELIYFDITTTKGEKRIRCI